MGNDLQARIDELVTRCERTERGADSYPYLPDIIESLAALSRTLSGEEEASPKTMMRAAGLGRLVTEDYAFSESGLGQDLLSLATDISKKFQDQIE